jgi:1-phosphofructokinase/tagatose 6-phosphate kinase
VVVVTVTITANPAYDVTYEMSDLVVGGVHRVREVHQQVGGKGINVARVLQGLGESTVAVVLGDKAFGEEARAQGLDLDLVEGLPAVRRTVVLHIADGTTTSLWEPGEPATRSAVDQLRARVSARMPETTGLVVSGSLPPGVCDDLPARLAEQAVAAGVPVIVDVDDEALRVASKVAGVVLVPNADELSRLTGSRLPGVAEVLVAARTCVDDGAAAVVATRGEDGLLAVTAECAWLARLDAPLAGNPTGAGDATVAGVIRGLAAARSWPDLLRDAVALSAAAVLAPKAGCVDSGVYHELLHRVTVDEVEMSGRTP